MIKFKSKGKFKKADSFFEKLAEKAKLGVLDKYGKMGVEALRSATPVASGATADAWTYTIDRGTGNATIVWSNTNTNEGYNIALLIQYGHGTGWGGYVKGRDFINPAIQPVFDTIAEETWKELIGL